MSWLTYPLVGLKPLWTKAAFTVTSWRGGLLFVLPTPIRNKFWSLSTISPAALETDNAVGCGEDVLIIHNTASTQHQALFLL